MVSGVTGRGRGPALGRFLRAQGGFSLAEALAATALLALGLATLLGTVTWGVAGVDRARRHTTAVYLAEQRLEQIKAFALSRAAGQGWGNVTSANFPAESYGSITGYTDYRRTVTVTDNPGGVAFTKQVEVSVFYRPASDRGIGPESSVLASTLMVSR